ncbi:proteasome lid subunit RPN8/RPN11 [Metabacillus crassostreae]|uniref:M67 family metallopeptidase n=1 Tax=Metabacillus crassostreae TaxID=929098 RepID=UPI00195729ED|nr:M67 family metallopeptidase [Metabacillus crassostreae]MBM7603157.1 proteasome lid subunit RPN8/RPN11 [Metabacillus crassostreae]
MEINEKLFFTEYCLKEIINHGVKYLPNEVCGILSGTNNCIQSVWKLKNELNSDRRFYVGKGVVKCTLKLIEQRGHEVLGIYHSHPATSPIPSTSDIINHPDPNVKMIIISYKKITPVVKCFKIHNQQFKEILFLVKQ